MRTAVAAALVLLQVLSAPATRAQSTDADATLAAGIRQYRDGEFERAVFTLDSAARLLEEGPAKTPELIRAYAYLGAAYVELNSEPIARAKFHHALQLDPALALSKEEFPRKVLVVFESVKAAAGVKAPESATEPEPANRPPAAGPETTAPVSPVAPPEKKGHSKTVPILLGVVGAGAGVAALAAGGGGSPAAPATTMGTPTITTTTTLPAIELAGLEPPPGSTISISGRMPTITMTVNVPGNFALSVTLLIPGWESTCCVCGTSPVFAVEAGRPQTLTFDLEGPRQTGGHSCPDLPVTTSATHVALVEWPTNYRIAERHYIYTYTIEP
jgi:hypothetical protein